MNNKILCGVVAAASILSLGSCNSDDPIYETTRLLSCVNLITPRNANEPSIVSEGAYSCHLIDTDYIEVSSDMLYYKGAQHTLRIPKVGMDVSLYAEGDHITFSSSTGTVDGSIPVSSFNGLISGLYYRIPSKIPAVSATDVYTSPFFIAQYEIGNEYSVATFQKDATYGGTTTTAFEFQGQSQAYESNEGYYRVIINPVTKKADIILYNVKFAEQSPQLILVLKDLDFEAGRGVYTVSGADVVPGMPDGSMLTPNESFPFESFRLETVSPDLTKIEINFTVRNKGMEEKLGNGVKVYYTGRFVGQCVIDPTGGK